MSPKVMLTTSWDDGHPLDMRVAEILRRHGLYGTFYTPLRPVYGGLLSGAQMGELMQMGMEIGSHTVTHPILTELDNAALDREMIDSRRGLEDMLGVDITSFCYPKGRFNRRVSQRAAAAGYRVRRTTVDFLTAPPTDAENMTVSMHLFPHDRWAHYRHLLRYRNWEGFWNWHSRFDTATDLEKTTAHMLNSVAERGGVFHLWGHSWELESHNLWPVFERVAALMGRFAQSVQNAVSMTNREVGDAARH